MENLNRKGTLHLDDFYNNNKPLEKNYANLHTYRLLTLQT